MLDSTVSKALPRLKKRNTESVNRVIQYIKVPIFGYIYLINSANKKLHFGIKSHAFNISLFVGLVREINVKVRHIATNLKQMKLRIQLYIARGLLNIKSNILFLTMTFNCIISISFRM